MENKFKSRYLNMLRCYIIINVSNLLFIPFLLYVAVAIKQLAFSHCDFIWRQFFNFSFLFYAYYWKDIDENNRNSQLTAGGGLFFSPTPHVFFRDISQSY